MHLRLRVPTVSLLGWLPRFLRLVILCTDDANIAYCANVTLNHSTVGSAFTIYLIRVNGRKEKKHFGSIFSMMDMLSLHWCTFILFPLHSFSLKIPKFTVPRSNSWYIVGL